MDTREGWEEVTELLRDLLLKPRTISGGEIVKAANTSDATSSQARDAPAASASDPASQPSHAVISKPGSASRRCESSYATSSDSSALWKAALEEKQKERAERESLPAMSRGFLERGPMYRGPEPLQNSDLQQQGYPQDVFLGQVQAPPACQAGSKVNFTAFLNDRSQPQAKNVEMI
eukprot:symbB.v1.2.003886.t1/scaffold211.1/size373615/27